MSRRVGAFVKFDRSELDELTSHVEGMEDRMKDMTVVMAYIATNDLMPMMVRHLDNGQGWPPRAVSTVERMQRPSRKSSSGKIGVGEHGGFVPTLERGWSQRNAVVFTRAPHAHLFEGGTDWYREFVGGRAQRAYRWGVKLPGEDRAHHMPRGYSEGRSGIEWTTRAQVHQPPRPFAYIDDDVAETASNRVRAFIVGDPFN